VSGELDQVQEAKLRPFVAEEDAPLPWKVGFQATLAGFVSEDQSWSEDLWRGEASKRRQSLIEGLTKEPAAWVGDIRREPFAYAQVRALMDRNDEDGIESWRLTMPSIVEAARRMRELEARFPNAGISDRELKLWTQETAATLRQLAESDAAKAPASSRLVGVLTGAITDPLVATTLPFGAAPAVEAVGARAIARTALKVGATEAGIQGALQVPIQAQVFDFKAELGSPYEVSDAALNVLAAGLGAGVLRATGSALSDSLRGLKPVDRAKKLLELYRERRAAGDALTDEVEDAAEDVAEALELAETNPFPVEAMPTHAAAAAQARAQADAMRPVDVSELVSQAGGRSGQPELLDPAGIQVDAKAFQFKGGGDAQGVTRALQGVTRWEPMRANNVIVYETKAGERFIVDGHQRLGLAKRAIATGQDPAEVKLFGFVLREADGVTRGTARRLAAIKNIAEGTGTAVDAAKVLREAGEHVDLNLPPNSAIVRDANGLAKLGDVPFLAVVNEVVEPRYGAIVGDLIKGEKEQTAVIGLLRDAEPANEVQARMMVEQARAAGFERATTDDLFGTMEVAQSLFKERAVVFDRVVRMLRRDKSTFGTLEQRAGLIAEEGNVLNAEANARRAAEAGELAAALAREANLKGPVSDALTAAAKALKDGASREQAAEQFLKAVRESKPRRVELPGAPKAQAFKEALPSDDPLLTPTHTIDTPEREAFREKVVKAILKGGKATKKGERPVAYVMAGGGGSGKSFILRSLEDQLPDGAVRIDPDDVKVNRIPEFKRIAETGDWRASAVVHEEGSALAKRALAEAIKRRYPIVYDRTMSDGAKGVKELQALKDAGYEVRLVGVGVADREVAWSRAIARGERTGRFVPRDDFDRAHDGFARAWQQYVDVVDEFRLYDNTDAPVLVARKLGDGDLEVADASLYNRLRGGESDEGQAGQEAGAGRADQGRDGPEAAGQGARGAEGAGARGGQAGEGAGARPAELTPAGARLELEGDLELARGDAEASPTDLTDYLGDDAARAVSEVEDQYTQTLAEQGDLLEVPDRIVQTDRGLEVETRLAGERVAELAQEEQALAAIRLCAVGGEGG